MRKLGLDKFAGVHPHGATHHRRHDVRAQALTVAHNGVLGLATQVANKVHTEIDGAQLFEKSVYLIE